MNVVVRKLDSQIAELRGRAEKPRGRERDRTTNALVRDMTGAEDLTQKCQELEKQVDAQACELNLLRARFARYETALRISQVTVYTQDRDLRYTSISNSMLGRSIEDILGRTDGELFA